MTTGLRDLPDEFGPAVVSAIDARLDDVAREHDARILLAVESGSRAWGFPSPDSDYERRFVHVRARDAYMLPWTRRDVIEHRSRRCWTSTAELWSANLHPC